MRWNHTSPSTGRERSAAHLPCDALRLPQYCFSVIETPFPVRKKLRIPIWALSTVICLMLILHNHTVQHRARCRHESKIVPIPKSEGLLQILKTSGMKAKHTFHVISERFLCVQIFMLFEVFHAPYSRHCRHKDKPTEIKSVCHIERQSRLSTNDLKQKADENSPAITFCKLCKVHSTLVSFSSPGTAKMACKIHSVTLPISSGKNDRFLCFSLDFHTYAKGQLPPFLVVTIYAAYARKPREQL